MKSEEEGTYKTKGKKEEFKDPEETKRWTNGLTERRTEKIE